MDKGSQVHLKKNEVPYRGRRDSQGEPTALESNSRRLFISASPSDAFSMFNVTSDEGFMLVSAFPIGAVTFPRGEIF